MKNVVDFSLQMKKDQPFTVLQLTDMQVIDASQQRYPTRLSPGEVALWRPECAEENCYRRMRKLVERVKPDLIVITGDIVYGQFDDTGRVLAEMIGVMDSFGIPWAPVYGNHDNESMIGVSEQCRRYSEGKYCLFRRGNVTGNCNYTLGLFQGETLCRIFYMADSNGCGATDQPSVRRKLGFGEDQIAWMHGVAEAAKAAQGRAVPGFFFCHIPTEDVVDAYLAAGYHTEEDIGELGNFEIGVTTPARHPGDSGMKNERLPRRCCCQPLREEFRKACVDGEFVGHCHKINTSVLYDGIRYTFGVKTGTYDYHERLGGTVITLTPDGKEFSVTPIYEE